MKGAARLRPPALSRLESCVPVDARRDPCGPPSQELANHRTMRSSTASRVRTGVRTIGAFKKHHVAGLREATFDLRICLPGVTVCHRGQRHRQIRPAIESRRYSVEIAKHFEMTRGQAQIEDDLSIASPRHRGLRQRRFILRFAPVSSDATVLEKLFDEAHIVRGRCGRIAGRLTGFRNAGAAAAGSVQPHHANCRRLRTRLVPDPERTLRSRWASAAAISQAASTPGLWLSTAASALRLSASAALVDVGDLPNIKGPPDRRPLCFRCHRLSWNGSFR